MHRERLAVFPRNREDEVFNGYGDERCNFWNLWRSDSDARGLSTGSNGKLRTILAVPFFT
jgi:hypothetical protein